MGKDIPKGEVWANAWDDDTVDVHDSREQAHKSAERIERDQNKRLLSCVRVSWVESLGPTFGRAEGKRQ
jgi:hypothetical protein